MYGTAFSLKMKMKNLLNWIKLKLYQGIKKKNYKMYSKLFAAFMIMIKHKRLSKTSQKSQMFERHTVKNYCSFNNKRVKKCEGKTIWLMARSLTIYSRL